MRDNTPQDWLPCSIDGQLFFLKYSHDDAQLLNVQKKIIYKIAFPTKDWFCESLPSAGYAIQFDIEHERIVFSKFAPTLQISVDESSGKPIDLFIWDYKKEMTHSYTIGIQSLLKVSSNGRIAPVSVIGIESLSEAAKNLGSKR